MTINDRQLEGLQKDNTKLDGAIPEAAAHAWGLDQLKNEVFNKPRTENSQSDTLVFTNPYGSLNKNEAPSEKPPSDQPGDKPNDAPREANEAPTPEQIELNKQVAKGMELIKEGKFDELCKLAQEIAKNSPDSTCGAFEKKLREEAKMDIAFLGNGKYVLIGTNDSDPNSSDKIVTSKAVKIKEDGTLVSAKEHKSGGGWGGKGSEKDLDPKQTYDEMMKIFKKNTEKK